MFWSFWNPPLPLRYTGKNPPAWLSPAVPVSGLFVVTTTLLNPPIESPFNGDTENTSTFSGESGSVCGRILFKSKYEPSAQPPG